MLLAPPLPGAAHALTEPHNAPSSSAGSADPVDILSHPAREWAVDAAANELRAIDHPGSYLRYRMHSRDSKGDRVRDVIESRDGSVARLLLKDGRPLTPDEDAAERERLQAILTSPEEFNKHVKNDGMGRKLALELVGVMPDAMLYTYVPGQPPSGVKSSSPQVVLDYHPNPHWTPPTTASEALTGLEGRMWIDSGSRFVVRMEGTISHPVNLGWGMVAHIFPGGKLALEQTNADGQRWIFTRFEEQAKVRALMVKTLDVHANVEASNFEPVAPMSYTEAIKLLLDTAPPPPAH